MISSLTAPVKKILSHYETDTPGVKASLIRLLSWGRTGGTGRLVILPVDQGFEHGPDRSFAPNPAIYDPHHIFKLAIDGQVSAFAAPLGVLEAGADTFVGEVPLILKINSSNTLSSSTRPDQAVTGSIKAALRLGCIGIGFTVYPGSDNYLHQLEEVRALIEEAKEQGLFTIIWSYPRSNMSKEGEQSIDVISYGAHMACLMGAHIVKVKLPTKHLERPDIAKAFLAHNIPVDGLFNRVETVRRSCFAGRRMVVFSGGPSQETAHILQEAQAIFDGGGTGSIIGRNAFQRPHAEGVALLHAIGDLYKG